MVVLDPWTPHAPHSCNKEQSSDVAGVRSVFGADILRQPVFNARLAVPRGLHAVEILPHGMAAVARSNIKDSGFKERFRRFQSQRTGLEPKCTTRLFIKISVLLE